MAAQGTEGGYRLGQLVTERVGSDATPGVETRLLELSMGSFPSRSAEAASLCARESSLIGGGYLFNLAVALAGRRKTYPYDKVRRTSNGL